MTGREARIIGAVAGVVGVSPRELVASGPAGERRAVYGRRLAAYVLSLDGVPDGRIAGALGRSEAQVRDGRQAVAQMMGRLPGLRADIARLGRVLMATGTA